MWTAYFFFHFTVSWLIFFLAFFTNGRPFIKLLVKILISVFGVDSYIFAVHELNAGHIPNAIINIMYSLMAFWLLWNDPDNRNRRRKLRRKTVHRLTRVRGRLRPQPAAAFLTPPAPMGAAWVTT